MNAGLAHTFESLFGPASELIDVSDFLQTAPSKTGFSQNLDCTPSEVAAECSVEDICNLLTDTWNNPILSGQLIGDHERKVAALHSTAVPKPKSVRKAHLRDPETLPVEVKALQQSIDSVSLKSFRFDADSVLFMRTSMNSDYNVLTDIKCASTSDTVDSYPEGVVDISIYDRVAWGPSYVTRSSQHALLCSQTLHDLYDLVPCTSKLPSKSQSSCVICIEGKAFSHHTEGEDHADLLIRHLKQVSKPPRSTIVKAPTTLKDSKISSLSVRINEPYWLIHSGNCEHFVVFDQIRLFHPSDRCHKYPLTIQISPVLLDLCRACSKVPAIWSIVGDTRLGESPCVLCAPCWKQMGESDDVAVSVVSLI